MASMNLPTTIPPPSERLRQRVGAMKPVRPRHPGRQLLVVALASLTSVTLLLASPRGLRPDLAGSYWLWLAAALCLLAFALLLWWALVPPRGQVLPLRSGVVWRVAGTSALLVGGLLVGARASAGPPFAGVAGCLIHGLTIAAIPALLCAAVIWRALVISGWPLACTIGSAAGALGGLFLQLHCASRQAAHIGIGHGLVIVLPALLLAGLIASARLTR
jgi:hypothetical protein